MRSILWVILSLFVLAPIPPAFADEVISDESVKAAIIQQSIQQYPGPCACPYSVDRAGRSCGRRSAYSKPGGYSPICYESDVTQAMIEAYKQSRTEKNQ